MKAAKTDAGPSAGERSPASSTLQASYGPAALSRQLGNQHLQMLLRAKLLQAKLTVSHPQDAYEHEADRVADQVMRMPDAAAPIVQRRCTDCEDELHRSEASAASVPTVDVATEQSIGSLSGRGGGLPDSVRSFMEPRFQADFSAVRVHNDAHAHHLARAVNAQAFTVGHNVVFGAGHYAPDTEGGKRLLAHELTHVVQQNGGSSSIQRKPADAKQWSKDVRAARYRGQVMAKRIRAHGKLSKEAEEKTKREVEYFEGAARAAYIAEVRPAFHDVGEIAFPHEMPPPLPDRGASLFGTTGGFPAEPVLDPPDETKIREEAELAAAKDAEILKLRHAALYWRPEDREFALSLLRPLIENKTNIDPRAVSDRIRQPILERYKRWLEEQDAFRKKICARMPGGAEGFILKSQARFHPEIDPCRSWFESPDSHGPAELRSLERRLKLNRLNSRGTETPGEYIQWDVFELRKLIDPSFRGQEELASGLTGALSGIAGAKWGYAAKGGPTPPTPPGGLVPEPVTTGVVPEPVTSSPVPEPVPTPTSEPTTPKTTPEPVTSSPTPEHTTSGAVTEPVTDDAAITQRMPAAPQRPPGTRIEQVGEYDVLGTREMDGNVLHRRIWGWARRGGANQPGTGPLNRFIAMLRADARAAGAVRLRISAELIANRNILNVQPLVERLGGTVRQIDAVTIEIEIPVVEPLAPTSPPARSTSGLIDSSRTTGPGSGGPGPGGGGQVTSGPKVTLDNEAPAVLYQLPDGIRLVTIRNGKPMYASTGQSVSEIDGVESTKTEGAFYEIAGAQETKPPPLPPGVQVPNYHKIGKGWLIKAKGFTSIEPIEEMQSFTYRLEPGNHVLTTPQQLNDWIAAHGGVPVIDFFGQVLGWK